jgi:hypothetical protein
MSIAPNFRILCLFSVFLFCSKLGIAAQAQNDPEPTCKIHFQIFPKALGGAERFTMQYLVTDANTSQAVHDEIITSARPNLARDWIEISGPVVDGRKVIFKVTTQSIIGLQTAQSPVFELRDGDSPMLDLHFAEVGFLDLELPKSIFKTSDKPPFITDDDWIVSLVQAATNKPQSTPGLAYISAAFGDRPLTRNFNQMIHVAWLPTSQIMGQEETVVFRVGPMRVGEWQIRVDARDFSWTSEPSMIQIEPNSTVFHEVKPISHFVPFSLEFAGQRHGPTTNFQAWSKQASSLLVPTEVAFSDSSATLSEIHIPAPSTDLLVSSAWMSEDDKTVNLYFSSFGWTPDNPLLPTILDCSPKKDAQVSTTFDPASAPLNFYHLTIRQTESEAGLGSTFPAEGFRLLLPNLPCQIFGLPVGQYQFTRTEFENPESTIDQCTVYVSK